MKSNNVQSSLRGFGASLWSFLLCFSAGEAQANSADRAQNRLDDFGLRTQMRADQRELRGQRREMLRNLRHDVQPPSLAPGITVPAQGERLYPPPRLEGSFQFNNVTRRGALPGQVSAFRTTRPERVTNRSTYINDSGRSRTLHQGVSLDLSSTDANITVGSGLLGDASATIKVGDETKTITAGSKVTAAEYAALNQTLAGGAQNLTLNSDGAAIDGSLDINLVSDNGRTITTSELVIPESVEVIGDFGKRADGVRVTKDLVNYGSLYAVSSKGGRDTAVIAARDVNNFEGGLITTNAPAAVAEQLGSKNDSLSLSVRADRDLNNAGEISSAGDLELTAGGAFTNSGLASARGSVSLQSASINNSGLVSATNGSVNLSSPINAHLSVEATDGEFRALNGNINIATTPGATLKTNTTLIGGDWYSHNLNISSGDGILGAKVGDVTGVVNINSGVISFHADTANLNTGKMVASGDPLMSSTGDVTINNDIFTNGQPLSIVAGGNVISAPSVTSIDTSLSGGSGGQIFIAAGAAFTTNPTNITITGGTAGGGNIDLPSVTVIRSGNFDNINGGDITMLAFEGAGGTGRLLAPNAEFASRAPSTTGDIQIIAESNAGMPAVVFATAGTDIGGSSVGGRIEVQNAQINVVTPVVINSLPGPTEGSVLSGSVTPGALRNGGVSVVELVAGNGEEVEVQSNGPISVQQSLGTITQNVAAGSVTIFSGNSTIDIGIIALISSNDAVGSISLIASQSITVDLTITDGFDGTGNISMLSSSGNVTVGTVRALGNTGNSGTISLTSLTGTVQVQDQLQTSGLSAGDISVFGSIVQFTNAGQTVVNASGSASSGDITIQGSSISSSGGVYIDNTQFGANNGTVNISANASTFTLGGSLEIFAGSNLSIYMDDGIIANTVGGVMDFESFTGDVTLFGGNISLTTNSQPGGLRIIAPNGTINVSNVSAIGTANAAAPNIYLEAESFINLTSVTTSSGGITDDGTIVINVSNAANFTVPTVDAGNGGIEVNNNGTGNINVTNPMNGLSGSFVNLTANDGDVNLVSMPIGFSYIELEAALGTIDLGSNSSITAQEAGGFGGSINLFSQTLATTSPTLLLSADSASGPGGSIAVEFTDASTTMSASASGQTAAGELTFTLNGTAPVNFGYLAATTTTGIGGYINVLQQNPLAGPLNFFGNIEASTTSTNVGGSQVIIQTPGSLNFQAATNVSALGGSNSILSSSRIDITADTINFNAASGTLHNFAVVTTQTTSPGITFTASSVNASGQNLQISSDSNIDLNLSGQISLSNSGISPSGSLYMDAGGTVAVTGDVNLLGQFGLGGTLDVTAGSNISFAGFIDVSSTLGGFAGSVMLDSGADLSVSNISAFGITGSTPSISLSASGSMNLANITAPGGTVAISNAANDPITFLTGSSITTSIGFGGPVGGVSISAPGSLVQGLVSIDTRGSVANGDISILAGSIITQGAFTLTASNALGGTGGVITVTTDITGGITTDNAAVNIQAVSDINLTLGSNGINSDGQSVVITSSSGAINALTAAIIATNNTVTLQSADSLAIGGVNAGTGDVNIVSGNLLSVDQSIIGDELDLTIAAGSTTIATNVNELTYNASGVSLTVTEQNSITVSGTASNLSLTATGGGAVITVGTLTNHQNVELRADGSAGGIIFTQNLAATTSMNLRSVAGTITQNSGVTLTTPDLSIALLTNATASLTNANNIGSLTGTGGGTITLNNDSNALTIAGLGASQNLSATTSSSQGITLANGFSNTLGTLQLTADRFFVDGDFTSSSMEFDSFSGNMTIEGTSGSSLTGLTPTAGPPGNPSTPAAITFTTGVGANLTLIGTLDLTGDVFLDNTDGTTESQNNSLFAGTNNITLKADAWQITGNGNITANNLILDLETVYGTIINTGGNVSIVDDITLVGHDLAILASGNISITSGKTIDISNSAGDGGNLLMVAGWTFTTSSGGQVNTPAPFTFSTPSVGGGSINASGVTILTGSGGGFGNNGKVTAIASGGSISLGNIDTSGTGANSGTGNVLIIAPLGITIGDIEASDAGSVTISASTPALDGVNPTVTNGTPTNAIFSDDTQTAGTISTGPIDAASGFIQFRSNGNISVEDSIFANAIFVRTQGQFELDGFNSITTNGIGFGGRIQIEANDLVSTIAGPITLTGVPSSTNGGYVQLFRQATDAISIGNDYVFQVGGIRSGAVDLNNGGDISIEAGGITAGGTSGGGADVRIVSNGVLTLNTNDFLTVDAIGSGVGGTLELTAVSLAYTSSIDNPLMISANGAGTGSGGRISIQTQDTTPVYIGTPAKAPKPPANFLNLSATAGNGGGDGGSITVVTGGSITANTASMDASASSTGNNTGAQYTLESGGSLIVTGDLDASGSGTGQGGFIELTSNNKKAFSFGTTKPSKNGLQGTITVDGLAGGLAIINNGGGIVAGQSLDIENVSLTASLKGTISTGKDVTLGAGSLNLTSDTGAIGKKAIQINSGFLSANSNAAVKINNVSTGLLFVIDSSAGKGGFNLTHGGDVQLDGLDTENGNVSIAANGDLGVTAGSTVLATNGSVTLSTADTAASITLSANSSVLTDGDKGGAVIIAIGAVPKKGVNRLVSDPPALEVEEIGSKGLAYYDGVNNGLLANGTGNLVKAENKPVILSNLNTGSGQIILDGGVTVYADPPLSATTASTSALETTFNPAQTMSVSAVRDQSPAIDIVNPALLDQLGTSMISGIGLTNATITATKDGASSGIATGIVSGFASGAMRNQPALAPDTTDLFIDASFHNGADIHHVLQNGNIVFAPQHDIAVETQHGMLKIAARSVTVVSQSSTGLSVYNLDDHGKNSVVLHAHGKQISLTPGQHVTVSNHASEQYAEINPIELVQHRGMNKSTLSNGSKLYISEFSIPSACFAVKPLRDLAGSKHKDAAKLRNHLMKTAAVIMLLRPDRGDFVQHFKSYTTAMK